MIKLYWQKIGFHWLWKVRKCGKFQKTNLLNSLWLHEKGPGVTSRYLHTFPALGSRSIFPAFHLLHATPCKEQLLDFPHLGLVSFVLGALVGTNFSLACLRLFSIGSATVINSNSKHCQLLQQFRHTNSKLYLPDFPWAFSRLSPSRSCLAASSITQKRNRR